MKKRNKALWWLLGIAVVIIGGFIALKSGWNFVKKDLAKQPQQNSTIKPLVENELKRMLIAASDSLYQIQFSSFVLNIDSGKGLIKGIQLTADSNIYKKLLAQHKAPNMMMNMRADSMFIDHFEFADTHDGKQFVVNNMLLQNPSIHIDYYPQSYNDTVHASSASLLAEAAKKLMQLSVMKHVKMNNLDFEMIYHTKTSTRKTALRNLDIAMDGMDIKTTHDSANNTNTVITIAGYHLTTADKLYNVQMNNLRFNPEAGSAFIEKAVIQPAYSKAEFFKHVSKANERFYFVYNNMQMQGIDMNRLIHNQQIKINKMTAASSVTDVYTDYELRSRKPPIRKHGFPHELLQQLAFDITIDTMVMHNGVMKYEIKARKSDSTALFEMDNIESKIVNITNNPAAKLKNHYTTVTTSGRVMHAANISSVYTFNLNDKNGAFTIKTEIDAMDGRALNPLSKPLALVEIKSLDIQKMITVINANEFSAEGNTDFYYKNMKVALLKKDDEEFKKRKLLSWVSDIMMADDNPKKNGKFKKGPISIKRDETDSFFKYLWRATFAGMAAHMMGVEKTNTGKQETTMQ